jgi:hypothetical protein
MRLLKDTAEALNRAYSEGQPHQQLLKEHRRLALSRAFLKDRLGHIRKLKKADATNPIWVEDVAAYETARLRELDDVITDVLDRNDANGIAAAWTELTAQPWSAGPPAPQLNRLAGLFIRQIGTELHDAVRGEIPERAIRARGKWQQLKPETVLPAGDPLLAQAQNDLAWIARYEDRQSRRFAFEGAIEAVEEALAQGAGEEQLCAQWAKVLEFRSPIPRPVEARYIDAISQRRHRHSAKERIILVTAFAIGAVVLVGFLVWVLARPQPRLLTGEVVQRSKVSVCDATSPPNRESITQ